MRLVGIILFLLLTFSAFSQSGVRPNQIQGSPYKGGVLVAKAAYYDHARKDTFYIYQHMPIDSLGIVGSADSIYINGEWVYSGDTVDITDTYVQFFDGGSFQNVTFTTGETIVFSGPAPGGVYLDNLGGGYYGILVNEVDGDIDNEKGSARMSGDSIFYKKCPYCVDSLIGVIIHPTYEPDPRIYRTGTIDFISPGWWGTAGIPLSGNLTIDNTNARDITQYVYHSASTPPLFSPASFSAVGTYVPDEVNVIKIEYVSNSEYHVSINR